MKKAIHILKNIFVWLVVILAVCMMIFTIVSVSTFDRADRNIFGYRAFIVFSDSMSATDFSAGDLILVKEVDPSTLQAGDIISYQSIGDENYGEIITHKIRERTTDEGGNPGFITYGTTTGENDKEIVAYNFVMGKYTAKLPGIGRFFQFLKTTPGYIVCIFLPFLVLILMQGVSSIRLFKRYKSEQLAELNADRERQKQEIEEERARLEEERRQSAEMMKELKALQEQLVAQTGGSTKPCEHD